MSRPRFLPRDRSRQVAAQETPRPAQDADRISRPHPSQRSRLARTIIQTLARSLDFAPARRSRHANTVHSIAPTFPSPIIASRSPSSPLPFAQRRPINAGSPARDSPPSRCPRPIAAPSPLSFRQNRHRPRRHLWYTAAGFRKRITMRSMTGYGRGEADQAGAKFSVELNSVNRKQSDLVINLPRDFAELEPRIRQMINEKLSRGRTNVLVTHEQGANGNRKLALDTALARSYHDAMRALQTELNAPGEITIGTILQAPGVMRFTDNSIDAEAAWPALEQALGRGSRRAGQDARTRRRASRERSARTSRHSSARAIAQVAHPLSRGGEKISRRASRAHQASGPRSHAR